MVAFCQEFLDILIGAVDRISDSQSHGQRFVLLTDLI